jgi:hypothetical protein
MDATTSIIAEFIRQGVLGIVIVGFLLGWLVPKWVVDEYRAREKVKDATIERLSAVVEKLAVKAGGIRHDDA